LALAASVSFQRGDLPKIRLLKELADAIFIVSEDVIGKFHRVLGKLGRLVLTSRLMRTDVGPRLDTDSNPEPSLLKCVAVHRPGNHNLTPSTPT
jgi:hypothetical protein